MNADEIVKALRHCYQEDIHGCEDCPLNESDLCYEANLELSAADLIEKLQVEVNEWQERHRQAAINWQQENKECVKLQAQLAESQRRERAAVEDIFCADRCDVCRHTASGTECEENDFDCLICQSETCICKTCRDEDKWQWRGPQEGEPHETV